MGESRKIFKDMNNKIILIINPVSYKHHGNADVDIEAKGYKQQVENTCVWLHV